jgi:hypothetical protein
MLMIVRIRHLTGIPGNFCAEQDLSLTNCGDFIVGGSEVKSDPAPLLMAAQTAPTLPGGRELSGIDGNDHKRFFEDPFHEPDVESAGSLMLIIRQEARADLVGTLKVNLPSAPRPKKKLDDPIDQEVAFRAAAFRFGNGDLEHRNKAVLSLQADSNGDGSAVLRIPDEFPIEMIERSEFRIEGRDETGGQIREFQGIAERRHCGFSIKDFLL